MPTRRERIEALLQDDPHDVFLNYSLAMEYCSEGQTDEGIKRLLALAHAPQPYVPACFMAAQRLVDQDEVNQARTVLRHGIEAARAQNDHHAAAEMADYLAMLGNLGE